MRPGTVVAEAATATKKLRDLEIELERKAIYYHQQLLQLTRFEFCLLQTLVEQPGRVFSRDQLLTSVGVVADAGYDRSIDGHIKTLRAKLRALNTSTNSDPIKTQRGFGYSYQPEVN